MSTDTFLQLLTTLVAIAVPVAAAWKYFTHRERKTIVRAAFSETVDALGATDAIHRRAGAIMLRRFFDENTEQGGMGALARARHASQAR